MQEIKFYSGENIPLELHKVRIVQKLNLVPIERRLEALYEGGFNTFRLSTKDVFLDMLTDSGTNAINMQLQTFDFDIESRPTRSRSLLRTNFNSRP